MQNLQTLVYLFGLFSRDNSHHLSTLLWMFQMLNQPLKAIKLKRTTFRAITGETKRNKDKKLKRTEQRKTHFWYKQQIVDTVEQEYCTSIIFNAKIVKAKGEHLHCRVFLGLKWVFRGDSAGKHSCYFLPFDKQICILNWSKWNHSFPLRSIQNLFYPRTSTSSNPCFSFLIWVVFVTL